MFVNERGGRMAKLPEAPEAAAMNVQLGLYNFPGQFSGVTQERSRLQKAHAASGQRGKQNLSEQGVW